MAELKTFGHWVVLFTWVIRHSYMRVVKQERIIDPFYISLCKHYYSGREVLGEKNARNMNPNWDINLELHTGIA